MCTLVLSGCELAAGTGPRRAAWGLVGVAEDDRAVVVRVGHGPCEAVDGVEALESTGGVEVTVRLAPTVPPDGCGDVLVVDTVAATLTAPLDGRRLTGCLRPSCTEADPDRLLTGPVDVVDVAGDAVVVADDRDVRALDRDTGEPRWERSAAELDVRVGAVGAATAPDGHPLAVLHGGGSQTVALDLATGEPRWRVSENPYTQPGLDGPVLAYALEDGTVKAFDTATGAARWELRLPGETPAAVVVAGDAVVVLGGERQAFGPGDGPDDAGAVGSTRVTALDAGTGQVRWVASAAGGPQQLTVADDLVVAHVTGGLYGFERATGASAGGRSRSTRTAGSCAATGRRPPSAPARVGRSGWWTRPRERAPTSRSRWTGPHARSRSPDCACGPSDAG